LPGRAQHDLLVRDESAEAHGVNRDVLHRAAARTLGDDLRGRVVDPLLRCRSHALRGEHCRTGGRVDFVLVVQLDDLRAFEERRRQLGEAHHQHGADCEVRSDHCVGRRLVEQLGELAERVLGDPGGAHDCVHAVLGAPPQVLDRGRRLREVDDDLDFGFLERVRLGCDVNGRVVYAELMQVDAGVQRDDGADQLHVLGIVHCVTHRRTHAAAGAEHPHSDHGRRVPSQHDLAL
jgi:hypothetical protein